MRALLHNPAAAAAAARTGTSTGAAAGTGTARRRRLRAAVRAPLRVRDAVLRALVAREPDRPQQLVRGLALVPGLPHEVHDALAHAPPLLGRDERQVRGAVRAAADVEVDRDAVHARHPLVPPAGAELLEAHEQGHAALQQRQFVRGLLDKEKETTWSIRK